MAQKHYQGPSHWQTRTRSLDRKSSGCWFTCTGLLWCAAHLVSSPPTICQLFFLGQLQTVTVQIQVPVWEAQKGSFLDSEMVRPESETKSTSLGLDSRVISGWRAAPKVKDRRNALAWHGTVWYSVVGHIYGETIPSALASWAYVRALMRRPFVLGRQAH